MTPFDSAQGRPITEALDRLDHIATCQAAISELLIPEPDLHPVSRDRLAGLLAFLDTERQLAREQLAEALAAGKAVIRSVR